MIIASRINRENQKYPSTLFIWSVGSVRLNVAIDVLLVAMVTSTWNRSKDSYHFGHCVTIFLFMHSLINSFIDIFCQSLPSFFFSLLFFFHLLIFKFFFFFCIFFCRVLGDSGEKVQMNATNPSRTEVNRCRTTKVPKVKTRYCWF